MRAAVTAGGRRGDHFEATVLVPAGVYSYQEPSLHLRNSDQSVTMFLDIDEVRELLDVLNANVADLQAADDRWAAERRAEREAKDAARELAEKRDAPDLMAALAKSIEAVQS